MGTALTIEMETGTGKTYTYIKTMFELNKQYGWTKFVIVVPNIAIREGVYKSFLSMEEHFAQEYGKRMQYFIYNSKQLAKIDSFASDPGIHVMIINTQAFNTSMNEDKNKEGRGGGNAARIIFDIKTANGTKQTTKLVSEGWNLYEQSGELEEYKDGYIIERIDGMDGSIHLLNGVQLSEGEAIGKVNEDLLRRIQIKETIRTHIERERQLFQKHIKVLSLFFIDHVSSYKLYGDEVETDSMGNSDARGKFAKMFEEEYRNVVREFMPSLTDGAYSRYLSDPRNAAEQVQQG